MLQTIKDLLNIKDESKDLKLEFYIEKAVTLIKKYLNNDEFDADYIKANYEVAIITIVTNAYELKSTGNVKSQSQGARSIVYKDDTSFFITDEIKSLLPVPYIKLFY